MNVYKTQLVRVGNSKGIRIPKFLLDQMGLQSEVEISMLRDRLVVRSAPRPREGWDEQFHAMAEHGDDQLLDTPRPTEWDRTDWTW